MVLLHTENSNMITYKSRSRDTCNIQLCNMAEYMLARCVAIAHTWQCAKYTSCLAHSLVRAQQPAPAQHLQAVSEQQIRLLLTTAAKRLPPMARRLTVTNASSRTLVSVRSGSITAGALPCQSRQGVVAALILLRGSSAAAAIAFHSLTRWLPGNARCNVCACAQRNSARI